MLNNAQHKIVVLAPIEIGPPTAKRFHNRSSKNRKVVHIVLGAKKIEVEIRFKVRVVSHAFFVDLVLIGINEIGVRMAI